MLAVVKEKKGPGYKLKQVEKPKIKDDEILIKIKAVGICGTDIPIIKGVRQVPIPLIPGHEFSGVVEEIGKDVKDFKVGDRVSPGLVIHCGQCIYCKQGLESLCDNILETGIHVDGAFAEYVSVPAKTAHIIPDEMTYEKGASIDPIASAYRPVKKANIGSEDFVLVFGPGPIGLYTMQIAKAEGARKVAIAGIRGDEERLALAKELGADYTINLSDDNIIDKVNELTKGQMADIIFDATGHPSTFEVCLDSLRKNGKLILVGINHEPVSSNIGKIVRKELKIDGSICYTWKDYHECIDLVNSNRINVDKMITHNFKLDEIDKALEVIENRQAMKVILHP